MLDYIYFWSADYKILSVIDGNLIADGVSTVCIYLGGSGAWWLL